MVNDIYTSIATRVEELFKRSTVYFNQLPQGFHAPCFFVKLVDCHCELKLYNRYEVELNFDIIYYPKDEKHSAGELNGIGEEMLLGLEYIKYDNGLIRGTGMRYEVHDGVLHFFVSYKFFILRPINRGEFMQRLYQYQGLKE